MKTAVSIAVGIILGFSTAWLAKPEKAGGGSTIAPQMTRAEPRLRPAGPPRIFTDHAAVDFFKRMQQAGSDQEQRDALFSLIPPAEIPAMLAKLQKKAGFFGLNHADKDALRGLLTTWYLKSPAAAQAWLQCADDDEELNELLGGIAEDLAGSSFDAAVGFLRQQETARLGPDAFSSGLFDAAVDKGTDGLLELCRIGLHGGPSRGISSQSLTYPEGFDFQRVADGLADMKKELGEDAKFMALPSNLIDEWAKREPQAAWDWIQRDNSIDGSGKLEFFSSYAKTANPTEVATLLAADFKPDAPREDRYENVQWVLDDHPSSELLDAFLEAAQGDRAENLQGLLDGRQGGLIFDPGDPDPVSKLILEHMEPEERLAGLRRIFTGIDDGDFGNFSDAARKGITPLLLRLGHGEEEIRSLFPQEKNE